MRILTSINKNVVQMEGYYTEINRSRKNLKSLYYYSYGIKPVISNKVNQIGLKAKFLNQKNSAIVVIAESIINLTNKTSTIKA